MHTLIAELRREHGLIIRALRDLSFAMDRMRREKPDEVTNITRLLGLLTREPDRVHHPKEELLFQQICQSLDEPPLLIRQLRAEHHSIAEQGQALIRALSDTPNETDTLLRLCHEYTRSQRWHITQEETELYRLAEQSLTTQDWAALELAVSERFGEDSRWDPLDWPEPEPEA